MKFFLFAIALLSIIVFVAYDPFQWFVDPWKPPGWAYLLLPFIPLIRKLRRPSEQRRDVL